MTSGNGNGKKSEAAPVGAAMVVGGGVAGIQAALDMADSGIKVYLVEKSPSIGGTMAQLDKTFPTNDCSMCILAPKLVDAGRHKNIDLLTWSEIEGIEGEPGHFKVKVRKKARSVDLDLCTGCGDCVKICPTIVAPDEFNAGLKPRPAISRPFPQAVPNAPVIDRSVCLKFQTSSCGASTCGAVDFVKLIEQDKAGVAPAPSMPPCINTCPSGNQVRRFITAISQAERLGRSRDEAFTEAWNIYTETSPFPSICGRVCPHPCELGCNRAEMEASVSVNQIERVIGDYGLERNLPLKKLVEEQRPQKVAIVGAGPGGLSCAYQLARHGYSATVFESAAKPGGMLRYGIPDYRLPPAVLDAEIQKILDMGVELKCGVKIGKDISLDDLRKQYDAVYLGIGAQKGIKLGVEGEDAPNVLSGVDFLARIHRGESVAIGDDVAIVGGGDTAIDAARIAKRLGAKQVTIVYRRTVKEMPAIDEEIEEAEKEGVKMHFLTQPVAFVKEGERVSAMKCIQMALGEPDSSGRRRPVPVEGSDFEIPVTSVIAAISQEPDFEGFGQLIEGRDWFKVDDGGETKLENVYAGGDAVWLDIATTAIGHGRRAAESMIRRFQGLPKGNGGGKESAAAKPEVVKPEHINYEQVRNKNVPRVAPQTLEVEKRWDAIDVEVNQTISIDAAIQEASRCLICGCGMCATVCPTGAINYAMQDEIVEIEVGAVLAQPGFDTFDPEALGQYGYGRHPNVITSLEFERYLSPTGPTQGHVVRPSDGAEPRKIAFLQCVGSRDRRIGKDYCSSVCCMYATKEAVIAQEHAHGLETTIFFMDMRCFGKDFEQYYQKAKNQHGVKYVRCRISRIEPGPTPNTLAMNYETEDGRFVTEEFDMAVLSVGLEAPKDAKTLAGILGLRLNKYGFTDPPEFDPLNAGRDGVFAAGAFQGPKDVPETVMQASAAASRALSLLSESRGTLTEETTYPDELPVLGDPPRIGVFVCNCGINIGSVVNVPGVAEYARSLPFVEYVEDCLFTCAQDTQELMKQKIKEHRLNRIVVAACSPRTHQPLFQQTMRECGLNPGLFEMANIRDHCSWVHQAQHDRATDKSMDLVRMAVRKASFLEPIHSQKMGVTKAALVVGGGVAGMTAALALAEKNVPVTLLEKEAELGGMLRETKYTIHGGDVQAMVRRTVEKVEANPLIRVKTKAKIEAIAGFVGNFETTIANGAGLEKVKHGVVIVATGALEKKPVEYNYGSSEKIVTQRHLETRLAAGDVADLNTVVMIQCVGSREDDRPYCSRVCCQEAVKNAIKLKELKPDARVFVLYRDMRTYGYFEEYYSKARDMGVLFVRFEKEARPQVEPMADGRVGVQVFDLVTRRQLLLPADLLALSMATVPNPGNKDLAMMLKVPVNADQFFLEAHMKLRPVDFATDGVFVCGLAHAPKLIDEAISQAEAAAGRAYVTLSKDYIETEANVSTIDPMKCTACGLCVELCPYKAIELPAEPDRRGNRYAIVNAALCKGCGVCASSCRCDAPDLAGFTDREIVEQMMGVL